MSAAKPAGYYIREGSYQGTTDDCLGRWYVGSTADDCFRPCGPGHRTQKEAWAAAREHAQLTAADAIGAA